MGAELLMVRGWLQPAPDADPDDEGEWDVVGSFPGGDHWILVGVELWRLVDAARADRILALHHAVIARPGDGIVYRADDLRTLTDLLDGLEPALRDAGVVDDQLLTPPDRAADLAARLPRLSARRDPSELPHLAGEGAFNVGSLRNFLLRALEQGHDVVEAY